MLSVCYKKKTWAISNLHHIESTLAQSVVALLLDPIDSIPELDIYTLDVPPTVLTKKADELTVADCLNKTCTIAFYTPPHVGADRLQRRLACTRALWLQAGDFFVVVALLSGRRAVGATDHVRNDVAAARHHHVQRRVVEGVGQLQRQHAAKVVQRGACHQHTAQPHWRQLGDRRDDAAATHLQRDARHGAHSLLRRKL